MRIRTTLIATAILSMIIGAVVVYLVLSVPNDLRADALLKQARQDLNAGKVNDARVSLRKIVQQYPRTDAAAAATVALVTIGDSEREKLRRELDAHKKLISDLQKSVTDIRNTPAPQPQIIVQQVPAPAPAKAAPAKKPPAKKRATTRRRR